MTGDTLGGSQTVCQPLQTKCTIHPMSPTSNTPPLELGLVKKGLSLVATTQERSITGQFVVLARAVLQWLHLCTS